jgi:hypothetical protein
METKMNHKKLLLVVTGLVLASLLIAACGTGSPSAAGFPTGKFVWEGSELQGVYLNEDQTWSAFYYGEEVDKGTYDVKGNLYTQETSQVCPSAATYEWSFDGTNLTFKLQGEDPCDIRKASFDGQTFILTK